VGTNISLLTNDPFATAHEIVAEHSGRFLRRYFRKDSDIVEDRCDVVEECEETGGHANMQSDV
jgi:hypothetical protein